MNKLRSFVLSVSIAALVALASSPGAVASELTTVRVIWPHSPFVVLGAVAVARYFGFFEREGLNVTFIPVSQDVASYAGMLETGRAEIGTEAYVPKSHPQLVSIFGVLAQDSTAAVIVRKDSGIRNLEDLRGKTVSSYGCGEKFGLTAWQLRMLLKKKSIPVHCLTDSRARADSVNIAPNSSTAGYVQILERGDAAASTLIPRDIARLTLTGKYEALVSTEEMNAGDLVTPMEYLFTTRGYRKEHPNVAKRFMAAMREGESVIRNHPKRAKAALAAYMVPKSGGDVSKLSPKERATLDKEYEMLVEFTPPGFCLSQNVIEQGTYNYSMRKLSKGDMEGMVDLEGCPSK